MAAIMAEACRAEQREVLRQACAITLVVDDKGAYRLVKFKCDHVAELGVSSPPAGVPRVELGGSSSCGGASSSSGPAVAPELAAACAQRKCSMTGVLALFSTTNPEACWQEGQVCSHSLPRLLVDRYVLVVVVVVAGVSLVAIGGGCSGCNADLVGVVEAVVAGFVGSSSRL